jgi:hypothetical protein
MLTWPDGDGPDLLVDDGVKYELQFAKTGDLPEPDQFENKD